MRIAGIYDEYRNEYRMRIAMRIACVSHAYRNEYRYSWLSWEDPYVKKSNRISSWALALDPKP